MLICPAHASVPSPRNILFDYEYIMCFDFVKGYLGYTKYEECVSTMMGYLPGLGLEAARERAQDIYFSTNATKWEEVSASNPIIGRYDFGKIEDATQKRSEDEIFDTTNAATLPTSISHFGTVLKSNLTDPNHISNFRNLLRGCSIGQEATDVRKLHFFSEFSG